MKLLTIALAAALGAGNVAAQPAVNAGAKIGQDFLVKVNSYMALRKAALQDIPPLKPGKADVLAHQRQLADRIQAARKGARQGDICTPEIGAELKRLIALSMQGPSAARIRRSLKSGEPAPVSVAVNGRFPDNLPLRSTPATVLLNLPRLPAEIEYRLIGRNLVLRDGPANVIIDFVPDALPVMQ